MGIKWMEQKNEREITVTQIYWATFFWGIYARCVNLGSQWCCEHENEICYCNQLMSWNKTISKLKEAQICLEDTTGAVLLHCYTEEGRRSPKHRVPPPPEVATGGLISSRHGSTADRRGLKRTWTGMRRMREAPSFWSLPRVGEELAGTRAWGWGGHGLAEHCGRCGQR